MDWPFQISCESLHPVCEKSLQVSLITQNDVWVGQVNIKENFTRQGQFGLVENTVPLGIQKFQKFKPE